jgi:hypothetical protein
MRSALLLLTFALNTFAAGPVIFGVRGGAPFNTTDAVTSAIGSFSTTRRYEIGPTLGVRLPAGFAVEGDALFRRETLSITPIPILSTGIHSDSWQFPVMLKYRGSHGLISPVLGAGVTVRHTNDFNNVPAFLFNGLSSVGASANTVGFVAGGGVRFRIGPMDVTPEIRFTRWNDNSFSQALSNLLPFSRNEVSFLVGVTF